MTLRDTTEQAWPPKHNHHFCHHHFNFSINLNLILNFYILSSTPTKMVQTRNQLENLSKEELIEELITVEDITSKLSDLSTWFDDFLRRLEVVSSDFAITRNCNRLLTERDAQLERNAVTNAQYHQWESVEENSVPPSINDEELELNICKGFSLTHNEVKPDTLQACHLLKKKESVIMKFKCTKLKQRVLVNRENLWNKSEDLCQLKFSGKLFISESMCHENHQLAYKCCQLKSAGKIHSTWFWNNAVNAKLSERNNPVKIFHIIDIEKLFGIDNLNKFISNTSF